MLINDKGVLQVICWRKTSSPFYEDTGSRTPFYYTKSCIIDGEEFVFGSYKESGKPDKMLHKQLTLKAVDVQDDFRCYGFTKKVTPEMMIDKFYEKCERTHHTTATLLARSRSMFQFNDFELWKTSVLLM